MKLIIGLGNPGKEFHSTRHNIGARCIDQISVSTNISLSEKASLSFWGRGTIGNEDVVLAKPRTFMNNSGEVCLNLVNRFDLNVQNLIVIYDDMDIPFGRIRIRSHGASGGHKGLDSIITLLDSDQFPRVRIGIGRPEDHTNYIQHVLSKFDAEEESGVPEIIQTTCASVIDLINNGVEYAMNRYN